MNIQFNEIDRDWKKNMWNKKFRNEYSGNLLHNGNKIKKLLLGKDSIYISISVNGVDCGFARMIDRHNRIYKCDGNLVRIIEEIFIDKEYRHKGLAAKLISYLRDNFTARHINMERERAMRLREFHNQLGFSCIHDHPFDMSMAFVSCDPLRIGNTTAIAANDNQVLECDTQVA